MEQKRETPDYLLLWKMVRERRSVRRYKPEQPDRNVLACLMEAASYAPSATNSQPWMFLVITKQDLKERMEREVARKIDAWSPLADQGVTIGGECLRDLGKKHFLFFAAAPVVIAVCYKPYPAAQVFRGQPEPELIERGVSLSIQSTAAAVQNILLTAHSFGLGACWLEGPLVARRELEALLQITTPWQLMCLVTLGYPDETPPPAKRKKIEFITRFIP